MKAVFFALALTTLAAPAFADWDGFGRGGDRDHGRGGWGARCTVSYKKCTIPVSIGGISFCPKWNSKSESVDARDARWACQRLERQYGDLKNCNVQCDDHRGGHGGGRGPGRRP